MEKNTIALNIFFIIGIFFIILGLYALSSNVTMKETIGEITHCSRVYSTHENENYWDASAKFSVEGKEYQGNVNVTSHKQIGQKIKILYNPKNPNDFISKSSTYSGIFMIVFGFIFLIPKLQKIKKTKKNF